MECPNCKSDEFNGWDCGKCGYAIPKKARKAHGRQLNQEEADKIRKKIFYNQTD
ncbi:MAG: hypothetical protein HYT65_01485 [Candidatus Yanofskybacteria bacterium]|nr:hypothetical protein [Candidatus Yanofskybacteria bacterium]